MKTEISVLVRPVNQERVLKKVNQQLALTENEKAIIDTGAIFENIVVDDDCCYSFLEPRLQDGKKQLVYDVPVRIKKKTDDGWSIPMCVDFYFPIPEDALNDCLDEPISLKDFMGSRYNYNPRIKKNMKDFLIAIS